MPKFKDAPNQNKSVYTTAVSNYFRDLIFDTAKWIYPDDSNKEEYEALSEVEKQALAKDLSNRQAYYLARNAQAVINGLKKDVYEYTYKLPEKELGEFCHKLNPDYEGLPEEEKARREADGKILREKYTDYAVQKETVLAICNHGKPDLLRPEIAMLDIICTDDNISRSSRIVSILKGNDIARKQKVYSEFFEKMEKLDLSGLDLTDDRNIIDNFERYKTILSAGPEIVNLIAQAAKYGMDFSDESKKPFLEKMGMIADISYAARIRIDMMTHPVYTQINFEELSENFFRNFVTDANGEDVDISDFFEDRGITSTISADATMLQYGRLRSMIADFPTLFDKSLSPDQRLEEYRKHYWDKNPEIGFVKTNVILMDGELIPAEYNDFATDQELEGIQPDDGSEIVKQVIEENPDRIYFDEVIEEPSEMRTEFEKNLDLIREIIPDYQISEDRIERYYSPRRLAIRDKFNDFARDTDKAHELFSSSKTPSLYSRIIYTYYNTDAGIKAAEQNEELAALAGAGSKEAEALRRKMYLDTVNAIQDLDGNKLYYNADVDEAMEYAADNIALLERGIDWQKINRNKDQDLGFAFSAEDEKNLTHIEDKGVVLGGMGANYRQLAQMSIFTSFPFDDLSPEQATLLADKLPAVLRKHGVSVEKMQEYNFALTFPIKKEIGIDYAEPEKKLYTDNDIIDLKPGFEETSEKLFRIYTEMLETSTLKELSEDNDFTRMADALKNTVSEMASVKGPIDAEKAASLKAASTELILKTHQFVKNAPDQLNPVDMKIFAEKNPGKRLSDFDQVRLQLSKEMKSLLDLTFKDDMLYETLICRHNETQGVEYDPKLFTDCANMNSLLEELGLEYSDVLQSAQNLGIRPEEYLGRVYQQNLQAKIPEVTIAEKMAADRQRSDMDAASISEFKTLGDIELFVDAKGEKSIDSLIKAFKACNRISMENASDTYQCFKAGELLNDVGERISDYIAERMRKEPVLDSRDIKLAKDTMKRHYAAAEALKTESTKSKELSDKVIKAVEKGGRVM